MKLKHLIPCLTLLIGASGQACQFSWRHVGEVHFKVGDVIAQEVTDDWCKRFSTKDARIVIITDTYYSSNRGLGHASVGVVKANSQAVPVRRFSAYSTDTNAKTLGAAEKLTEDAIRSALQDLMSVVDSITPD